MENQTFKIFVVEDNEWYNKLLVHNLSLNPDFEIESFHSGKDLLKKLHAKPNVITLDFRLPDIKGDELLKEIKERSPHTEVVIISEQNEIETAVHLLKAGAYDYLVKADDIRDRLLTTIGHIRKNVNLKKQIVELKKEVQTRYSFEKSIIGKSKAIKQVFEFIEKAIETSITVAITGETGTGKEVVAKAIHYNSKRKDQPFVAVNMAAIPSDLIESELFGHEKGAFTGASARRIGKFEEANGGTLFLDEIGETDPAFQAKLLRALQEKEIVRVGSNQTVKLDCRIIVATNRDLKEEVKQNNFREDLYYRLLGIPIHLPPIRERGKDVLLLAKHFVSDFCQTNDLPEKSFNEAAISKISGYQWPGNVRELKSIIELAVVMSSSEEIKPCDITISNDDPVPQLIGEETTMREYNQRIIQIYMSKYADNTKIVAEKLGIGQTTVYRLLKEIEEPNS